MSEQANNNTNNLTGQWLGWIGIVLGIIGFFWLSIWLGIIAIILGICGLFTPQKILNWVTIVVGIIALIIGFF